MPAPGTRDPARAVTRTRVPRLLLAGLVLATVMATLDTQVVATALPTIVSELAGLTLFGWVSTAYLLALAVVTPLAGKLGDLVGRRPVFLGAVGVFLTGSALCGLAQSMPQLVAFRAAQGIGAGGLTVSVFAIVGELFDPRQRARYQGLFATVFAVSGLAGPVIGGALTQHLGWRSVFYLNLPLGAVTLATAMRFLRLPRPDRRPRVDVGGTLLLGAAVSALVLATSRAASPTGNTALSLALAVLVFPLLAGWVLVERRVREPVMPLSLFQVPSFTAAAIIAFVGGAAALGLVSYLALFLQRAAGASATTAGLLLLPGSLGIVSGSVLAGWHMGRSGRYRALLGASMGGGAAASGLLASMGPHTPTALIALYLLLYGLTAGLSQQTVLIAAQAAAPSADLGAATGAITFARLAGSSLGIALFGAVLNARLPTELAAAGPTRQPEAYAAALSTVFAASIPLLLLGLTATVLRPANLDVRHTAEEADESR